MKIVTFRIRNFKSFRDSESVSLSPDMNVLTGQNNVGKTALLQALEFTFPWAENRSIESMPARGERPATESIVEVQLSVTGPELHQISLEIPELRFTIPPNPGLRQPHPLGIRYDGDYLSPYNVEAVWNWIIAHKEIQFSITRKVSRATDSTTASHGLFHVPDTPNFVSILRRFDAFGNAQFLSQHEQYKSDLGFAVWQHLIRRIYRFSAERFSLGDSPFGAESKLAPDARNLAEALGTLQPNTARFKEFLSRVNYILPQVKSISVEPRSGNHLRIKVWPIDKETKRDDLAIPLVESGTGIGQVLSILYVAFTSETPQVLLIDEPQSFLHPGAARKLVEVLKELPQHQYVITTHSPSIISAADPKEILILRSEAGVSKLSIVEPSDSQAILEFLQEIGSRLSDVFGMDRVIWVEGSTEELSYPLLIKKLGKHREGTAIVGIRNTGDLESRDAKKIFEIYRNLTRKQALLPPIVVFILDSETRSAAEKKELQTLSEGKAHFSPKRTFENYLLNENAICAVVTSIEGFTKGKGLQAADIGEFFATAIQDRKYWNPEPVPKQPTTDANELNGALLIADLFAELSESRVSYRKTQHSVELFRWLLDNDFEHLKGLAEFVSRFLD